MMGHPDPKMPFDYDDDGLPGWPLTTTLVLGLVITMPLWLPVCVAYAAWDYAWNGRRG